MSAFERKFFNLDASFRAVEATELVWELQDYLVLMNFPRPEEAKALTFEKWTRELLVLIRETATCHDDKHFTEVVQNVWILKSLSNLLDEVSSPRLLSHSDGEFSIVSHL